MPDALLYDVDDAVEMTRLGRTKLYELMANGTIPSVKAGRRRLIPAQALRDFVDGLVSAATEGPPVTPHDDASTGQGAGIESGGQPA